jgi:hypothetical protein
LQDLQVTGNGRATTVPKDISKKIQVKQAVNNAQAWPIPPFAQANALHADCWVRAALVGRQTTKASVKNVRLVSSQTYQIQVIRRTPTGQVAKLVLKGLSRSK